MRRHTLRLLGILVPILSLALAADRAEAQPFGAWMIVDRSDSGSYVEIPHDPALNPTGGFTFEAWVAIEDPGGCSNIAGKDWTESWWVGLCGNSLRSYLRGSADAFDAGTVPSNVWTHVAVTWDGSTRRHYVNGVLAGSRSESDPPTTSTAPMRIGSDVEYAGFVPNGSLNEVRLWSVGRTHLDLLLNMHSPIDSSQPGLVGVWRLDGNADTSVGSLDGTIVGSPGFLTFPAPGFPCFDLETATCLADERFKVSVIWHDFSDNYGPGRVVSAGSDDSGLFWFFNADNWEMLFKLLNGCSINDRFWFFSAATTNVEYLITVEDMDSGAKKTYLNPLGTSAAAITDTDAFATCP